MRNLDAYRNGTVAACDDIYDHFDDYDLKTLKLVRQFHWQAARTVPQAELVQSPAAYRWWVFSAMFADSLLAGKLRRN